MASPAGRDLTGPEHAFVWTWLPGATEPVVAGRVDRSGPVLVFTYGRSYLERADAVPLYLDLPLEPGPQSPRVGEIAGCLADAAPDAWGRRVIERRLLGAGIDADDADDRPPRDLDLLTLLVASGRDRIGALDVWGSPTDPPGNVEGDASLDELAEAADRIDRGEALSPELDVALLHGSSVGGARPKVLLRDGDRSLIAKLSSSTDQYPVVRAEAVAMDLARRMGLDVARTSRTQALGRDVLLVERFDRPGGGTRRAMVSALTVLGLDEHGARYASYADLADAVRARFADPRATLRELFSRITANVLLGNTDDHAKNHAAFWDGRQLTLTPAYDVCPQLRAGGEAAQAMAIGRDGFRLSQVVGCVERSDAYLLDRDEAADIVEHQVEVIRTEWDDACDQAGLTAVERTGLWGRQVLNPFALEGFDR